MPFQLTPKLLTDVASLPKSQRIAVMAEIGQQEFNKCSEDPIYWIDYTRHVPTVKWPKGLPYVFTADPHNIYTCTICEADVNEERRVDHMALSHSEEHAPLHRLREVFERLPSVRPFPMYPYITPIIESWMGSQYFVCEKSRDMGATWLMIALHTWDAMFHSGRQQILQSEDAIKTLELVQRARVIYENHPKFLRDIVGPGQFNKSTTKSGELYFTKQKSEILGLPQGPNQIRQYHPSSVFADEAAFQLEAGSTFAAIKPAIMNGGRYTAISSANRSWFELVCKDKTDD